MPLDPPMDTSEVVTEGPESAQHQPQFMPPSAPEEEPTETNRDLLTIIAQMSEGVVRASSEKVNVARHTYDLVSFSFPSSLQIPSVYKSRNLTHVTSPSISSQIDRYIRDLDRSIKEEETSLSVGPKPGPHATSIILPEVVVPSLKTHRRTASTPIPEGLPPEIISSVQEVADQDVVMADETNPPVASVAVSTSAHTSSKPPSKRKSSRMRGKDAGGASAAASIGPGRMMEGKKE